MKLIKYLIPLINILPAGFVKKIGNMIIDILLSKYGRITIKGEEIIKERIGKPTIFISNHLSNVDGVILNKLLKKNRIKFMAGVKLGENSFTSFFLKIVDHIAIKPNTADRAALKEAIAYLKENGSIMIFPEGTRSRTASLINARKGFTLIAKSSGAPMVPIAIEGTEKLMPINDSDMGNEKLYTADVTVSIGEPFYLPDKNNFESGAEWEDYCVETSMKAISKMLKPEYQGVYKIDLKSKQE